MSKVIIEKLACDCCGSDSHVKQFLLPAPKRISSEEDPEILPVAVDLCINCYLGVAQKIHDKLIIQYDMQKGLIVKNRR